MPLTGPLFKFALFQTWVDEFYLFACCHHIVIDGTGIALVGHRIATVYSAIVSGAPIPPPSSARCRTWLTASWHTKRPTIISTIRPIGLRTFPRKADRIIGCPRPRASGDPYWPSAPVRLDPAVLRRVDELSRVWNVPRSSVITAACALLVRGWCAEGSEVVLDFPVSRRVRPESKTLPGMVAGVVPLVLTVSPGSTVADFCEHVDTRIREAVQHQRFPVHALERKAHSRGAGRPADQGER